MILMVYCSSSEIPQFRLPYDVVSFEVELMKDLGVKVQYEFFGYFIGIFVVMNCLQAGNSHLNFANTVLRSNS